jgi:hypothetical protein
MGENQGPDTEKEQMYWEHQNKEPENEDHWLWMKVKLFKIS